MNDTVTAASLDPQILFGQLEVNRCFEQCRLLLTVVNNRIPSIVRFVYLLIVFCGRNRHLEVLVLFELYDTEGLYDFISDADSIAVILTDLVACAEGLRYGNRIGRRIRRYGQHVSCDQHVIG